MSALMQAGRYAGYVDAAWGASALVLATLAGASWLSARRWRRRAEARRPELGRPEGARTQAGRRRPPR